MRSVVKWMAVQCALAYLDFLVHHQTATQSVSSIVTVPQYMHAINKSVLTHALELVVQMQIAVSSIILLCAPALQVTLVNHSSGAIVSLLVRIRKIVTLLFFGL